MRNFFDEQGRTRNYEEAYEQYVDAVIPRRTQPMGKIAISNDIFLKQFYSSSHGHAAPPAQRGQS